MVYALPLSGTHPWSALVSCMGWLVWGKGLVPGVGGCRLGLVVLEALGLGLGRLRP